MRVECEELAPSLLKYAKLNQDKKKSMKLVYSSLTPWRSIGKGLNLFYLEPTKKLFPELKEISAKAAKVGPYCKVDLQLYLPTNLQKRYLLT